MDGLVQRTIGVLCWTYHIITSLVDHYWEIMEEMDLANISTTCQFAIFIATVEREPVEPFSDTSGCAASWGLTNSSPHALHAEQLAEA